MRVIDSVLRGNNQYYSYKQELAQGFFFLLLSLIFIFFGAFIAQFSRDYEIYLAVIGLSPGEYDFRSLEPFFWVIVYINRILFDASPFTLYVLYGTVMIPLYINAFKKLSVNPLYSFLVFLILFYPNHGANQIRQGLAAAIFLNSIKYIYEKKLGKYILLILLASLCHYSAVILFPIYFIVNRRYNIIFYVLLPILGYAIGKIQILTDILLLVAERIGGPFAYKAEKYVQISKTLAIQYEMNRINLINSFSLSQLIFCFLFLYLVKPREKLHFIFLNILSLSIFSWFAFSPLPVLSFRLGVYFQLAVAFVIPYIVKQLKERYNIEITSALFFLAWVILLSLTIYDVI